MLDMKPTTSDARRRNLKALIDQWGGPSSLAKKLGHSGPSYLSQLTTGITTFSEKTARKIEDKLALPAGWLDGAGEPAPKIDTELLATVVEAVSGAAESAKLNIRPAKMGEIVALVYEEATKNGHVDEDFIGRLLKLMR